jgi:hypothetical protein
MSTTPLASRLRVSMVHPLVPGPGAEIARLLGPFDQTALSLPAEAEETRNLGANEPRGDA